MQQPLETQMKSARQVAEECGIAERIENCTPEPSKPWIIERSMWAAMRADVWSWHDHLELVAHLEREAEARREAAQETAA